MYFVDVFDENRCFKKHHIIDVMKVQGLKSVTANEAVTDKDDSLFWCKEHGQVSEKGICGKDCPEYAPRNGSSGCCKHFGPLYEKGKEVTLYAV